MIVCPNCNHHNPEGAAQCEACYTPLPEMMACPNCGAPVQVDANFCGQCGFSIQAQEAVLPTALESRASSAQSDEVDLPLAAGTALDLTAIAAASSPAEPPLAVPLPETLHSALESLSTESLSTEPFTPEPPTLSSLPTVSLEPGNHPSVTQLQTHRAALVHVRSDTEVYLPENLPVVHIGKPNDRIPPDLDVSGFPDSEVVSRVHADIRVEGDAYYIEDLGSSNGTYVNNLPLAPGNRHRLRMGDRIALGKGDLVTFLFQVS
ncbi:MAG: FHA domain-containing protein [Synechococcales cyanobacterium CRU_2_2]|nr:FHA domain-containing protein [Synechococcales cyanobacterium CRU_2_2]